jgi:hypothetical protein
MNVKTHFSILMVALLAFSLPQQANAGWWAFVLAVPWMKVGGLISATYYSAKIFSWLGNEYACKHGRKRCRKLLEGDGVIDWHSEEAIEADGFIHRYMREHMTEIEDIMEPDMKAETLKHTPQEIEDALSNSYEHFIEEHRAEFAEEVEKHSKADPISLVGLPESDHVVEATGAKKLFSPTTAGIAGMLSLAGMTVFAVARTRSRRASLDPASQGFELESGSE